MRKIGLILIILMIISENGYTQNDTLILKRLNKPILNCEIIAFNSQDLISSYGINQFDSISQIIKVWENVCGFSEPIQRLKILFDIKQNRLVDTVYKDYLCNEIRNFKYRVLDAQKDNYKDLYEYNKTFFYYVPLRSKYDEMTKHFALDMIGKQKRGTSEYLFCLLFSEDIEAFFKEMNSGLYSDNFIKETISENLYKTWNKGITFNILAGTWFPLGKLSKTFSPSPQFGLSFGGPFNKTLRMDVGIILIPLVNDKNFDLNINNTDSSVNAKMCLILGAWISKEFDINEKMFYDLIGGIGLGRIDTDLKKPKSNSEENDKYYGLSTIDISLGANVRMKIFKRSSIGVNYSIHYAPYNFSKYIKKDIGNLHTSLSLIYRF